jgi:hypothetical protein
MPGHSTFNIGLLCLPRRLSGVMVIEAIDDGIPVQRRGRILGCGQRYRGVLLAPESASRTSCAHWQGHGNLLWQCLGSLLVWKSSAPSPNEACGAWHSFCAREGGPWSVQSSANPNSALVCKHYDKRATNTVVQRFQRQFVHRDDRSFNRGGGC